MVGRALLFASCLSLVAKPLAAADVEPVVLEPSTPWQLDYGEARCRIMRLFGEGPDASVLYFEQFSPSQQFDWLVAGPMLSRIAKPGSITFQAGPSLPPVERTTQRTTTFGAFGPAVAWRGFREIPLASAPLRQTANAPKADEQSGDKAPVGLLKLDPAEGAGVEWFQVTRGNTSYRYHTGNLKPVYEAMNTCMVSLIKSWGADPAMLQRMATEPRMLNQLAVANALHARFPAKAERKGKDATLVVRLMVEADGTPSKCQVVELTQGKEFEKQVCTVVMKTATLTPSKDIDGQSIPAPLKFLVTYSS